MDLMTDKRYLFLNNLQTAQYKRDKWIEVSNALYGLLDFYKDKKKIQDMIKFANENVDKACEEVKKLVESLEFPEEEE